MKKKKDKNEISQEVYEEMRIQANKLNYEKIMAQYEEEYPIGSKIKILGHEAIILRWWIVCDYIQVNMIYSGPAGLRRDSFDLDLFKFLIKDEQNETAPVSVASAGRAMRSIIDRPTTTMSNEEICEGCKFFLPILNHCRLNAPIAGVPSGEKWPWVSNRDSCGQYKRRRV